MIKLQFLGLIVFFNFYAGEFNIRRPADYDLFRAAAAGDLAKLISTLKTVSINARSASQQTALMYCAAAGNLYHVIRHN